MRKSAIAIMISIVILFFVMIYSTVQWACSEVIGIYSHIKISVKNLDDMENYCRIYKQQLPMMTFEKMKDQEIERLEQEIKIIRDLKTVISRIESVGGGKG